MFDNGSGADPAAMKESMTCAFQWRGFLRALAEEFAAQLSREDLRALFRMTGRRMAKAAPLQARSMADFERSANAYLKSMNWGRLETRDLGSAYEFVHSAAPLRDAFGNTAMEWSPALLEGLYAEWLSALGAGSQLELHQVGEAGGEFDSLQFRLARAVGA